MNGEIVKAEPKELLKNGIKGIHEAFADYMLINPSCTLREMKAHFGYSVPWICTVINSDIFQAYFSQRRQGINAAVADDLPTKLRAAAHLAVERVMEVLEKTEDADTIIDSFDKVLHRHGYAPTSGTNPGVVNNTQNVFMISREDLAASRVMLLEAHAPAPIEGEVVKERAVSSA